MKKKVQRISGALLSVCMLAAFVPAAEAAPSAEGHWAQAVIQDFVDRDYLSAGISDPDAAMTCGQFTALIDTIIGSAAKGAAYTDADAGSALTREQAMTIVASLLDLTATSEQVEAIAQFSDYAQISADARNAVAALVAAGYINGTPEGSLMPRKMLTVAEGVTLLSNALDALPFDLADYDVVYGKATLTFAEYYSGDVSSTDSYGVDGVSSATVGMYNSFNGGMYTNYTEDKTEGYNILGVKNVNIAVSAEDYEAYLAINPTFQFTRTTPQQYKTVTVFNDKAVYSATNFNVVETVTDAAVTLKTGSTWGDYEIDVTENSTANIRNNRTDEGWAINANIQGAILETESGLRVGMEFLQSMWLQPWEVSFNVTEDSAQNAHIVGWDNLPELAKLVGEKVTSITYIMPDSTYIYTVDGIYIKPAYSGSERVSASFAGEGSPEVIITGVPEALKDVMVTITCGSGRGAQTVANAARIQDGKVTMDSAYDSTQTYTIKVSSSNYADIVAALPISSTQREQLTALVDQAKTLIENGTAAQDEGLIEHYEEAIEMLEDSTATSAEAAELITDLTGHLSVYITSDPSAH
ncbi:MAG: S-layer homology domain-containing protein [Oscillospiraceae bacterium]